MAKNGKKKWIKWVIALAAVVLLAMLLLRPQSVPADFAAVTEGPIAVTVDEEGETRVRERFVVSAPFAGRVLRITLEPGDPVSAGETVLATFQPEDPSLLDTRSRAEAAGRVRAAEAGLGRARADRQRAAAEQAHADAELVRYRQLAADEVISQERLDTVALEARTREEALRAADFAVRNAQYELEVARARLLPAGGGAQDGGEAGDAPLQLRAPVNGVVLRRLRESETVVPPGEPLLEVGDPVDLEIVADFLSGDAVKIRRGQSVRIEQWGGERPLEGVVRRVEPSGFTKISALGVEEQRVNVIIDFADPDPAVLESLGDGFRVEVRVVVAAAEDVVKVPTSSLFRHEGGWAVFAVTAGKAVRQPVEIGLRNGLEAEVTAGLEAEQEVIVHPSDAVEDGVAVAARES